MLYGAQGDEMRKSTYLFAKRAFDIIASLLAVMVFMIPWLVIGIIIKIQSPGPVIYKARRVGINGTPFTLYKFRSMRFDSGAVRITTLRNDSRIFPFGKFLRKSKLDETPQLLNILKGDMSVIGPRPEDEENAKALYRDRYTKILDVKPGLSSPASLFDFTHGEKVDSEEAYKETILPIKLELELYYVKNRTFSYDIGLVFKTVVTIIKEICGMEAALPKEIKQIQDQEKVESL